MRRRDAGRGASLLRRPARILPAGPRSGMPVSGAAPKKRTHLAAARIGVVRVTSATGGVATGSVRTAARRGCSGGERFAPHSFELRRGSSVTLVSSSLVGAVIVGQALGHQSRRSAGRSPRRGSGERCCVARPQSSNRITARWSRRASRPVRSCHRGARLSASVSQTEKTNLGSFPSGLLRLFGVPRGALLL